MRIKRINLAKERKSLPDKWLCCESGCENRVAKNNDGTIDGNYRCVEHTRAYYARYWYKGQTG